MVQFPHPQNAATARSSATGNSAVHWTFTPKELAPRAGTSCSLCSRWFGYDFDSIIGHAPGTGVSDEDLEAVKKGRLGQSLGWKSARARGGGGLHLYALCCDEGIPTANHTEHAALGRAILEKMAVIAGFNFSKKLDVCGGNMWIWHRK